MWTAARGASTTCTRSSARRPRRRSCRSWQLRVRCARFCSTSCTTRGSRCALGSITGSSRRGFSVSRWMGSRRSASRCRFDVVALGGRLRRPARRVGVQRRAGARTRRHVGLFRRRVGGQGTRDARLRERVRLRTRPRQRLRARVRRRMRVRVRVPLLMLQMHPGLWMMRLRMRSCCRVGRRVRVGRVSMHRCVGPTECRRAVRRMRRRVGLGLVPVVLLSPLVCTVLRVVGRRVCCLRTLLMSGCRSMMSRRCRRHGGPGLGTGPGTETDPRIGPCPVPPPLLCLAQRDMRPVD